MCLPLTNLQFALSSGRKEVEDHRRQLAAAKQQAESITTITPELEKAFLEVGACFIFFFFYNFTQMLKLSF